MKCDVCDGQLYVSTVTLYNIVGVPVGENGEFDIMAARSWEAEVDDCYCENCGLISDIDDDASEPADVS